MKTLLLALLLPALSCPLRSAQDATDKLRQRRQESAIFEVRDLLRDTPSFSAPTLGVARLARPPVTAQPVPQGGQEAPPPAGLPTLDAAFRQQPERDRALLASGQLLAQLTRAFIQPPLEPGQGDLQVHPGGTMVLQGSSLQSAWLKSYLGWQRAAEEKVEVQATLVRLPRNAVEALELVHGQTLDSGADLQRTLEALASAPGYDQLNSPTVQMFQRQRAALSVTDQVAFIEDWSVQVVGSERQEIADPQISVLDVGTALEVVSTRLDERFHGLLVHVQYAEVEKPIPVSKVPLGSKGTLVEVHRPKVHRVQIQSTVTLAPGASAVLIAQLPQAEQVMVVLVTLVRVL